MRLRHIYIRVNIPRNNQQQNKVKESKRKENQGSRSCLEMRKYSTRSRPINFPPTRRKLHTCIATRNESFERIDDCVSVLRKERENGWRSRQVWRSRRIASLSRITEKNLCVSWWTSVEKGREPEVHGELVEHLRISSFYFLLYIAILHRVWSRGRMSRFEYSLIDVLTYFSFSTSIASCNDEEQRDNPATKRSYDVDREFRNTRLSLTKNFYDPGNKNLFK